MALESFEEFCTGQFWNETLLLRNSWPQFTDCFIHTVVIWVPCGFLLLALPYYVSSVGAVTSRRRGNVTPLFQARLFCCLMLAMLALIHLFVRAYGDALSRSPAAFVGDILYITAYVLLAMMTQNERLKDIHTSPVTFFFWLLASICNVIPFYTFIIEKLYTRDIVSFLVFMSSYLLQLSSLGLAAFVEHKGPRCTCSKQQCPETTCSFPSFLGFWWMNKLIFTGYKRDIEESDMWSLPPAEQSALLVPRFERKWEGEKTRCKTAVKTRLHSSERRRSGSDHLDKQPFLRHSNTDRQDEGECNSKKGRRPNLLRVILRLLMKDIFFCFVQKSLSYLFFLLSPVVLGCLIKHLTERPEGLEWQGYVLSVAMFVTLIVKSLLFAHAMFLASRIGLRMKSTLIGAVYRKALTMSSSTRNSATVGEIVNLMSVDAQRVQDVMMVIFYASTTPILFVVAVILLYYTIGLAIFVGMLLLVCCVPLNAYVISRERTFHTSNLKFKDARIRLYNEILNGIKVLKLYAWEPSFREKIREIRLKEVAILFKLAVLNTLMSLCWDMAPFLVTLVTFATYVLADPDNELDAGKAFVSLSLFNVLRPPLAVLSKMIMFIIQAQVSFRRINIFLVEDDLEPDNVQHDDDSDAVISIRDGTFTWDSQLSPALTNINLTVGEGGLVAVVGPVGCGKSSLISAMLGEMNKVSGRVICRGSVAYVPQQAWIQNATLRDNVLFGKPYIRSRYRRVIQRCELERDLRILSHGDVTEIGEKGINLSGGQKQRVSMARAVYSDSDVYLLDDPLSAVDSHVGKAIFSNVIGPNGLLRNKTRVLVTHGVHWLLNVDEVIVMNEGRITERGSYEELVSHDGPFAQFLKTYLTDIFEVEEEEDPEIAEIHGKMRERLNSVTSNASSEDYLSQNTSRRTYQQQRRGTATSLVDSVTMSITSDLDTESLKRAENRLNTSETVSKGKVDPAVFKYYARAIGVCSLFLAFLSFCTFQAFSVGANYWLKAWTQDSSRYRLDSSSSGFQFDNVTTNNSLQIGASDRTDAFRKGLSLADIEKPSFVQTSMPARNLTQAGNITEAPESSELLNNASPVPSWSNLPANKTFSDAAHFLRCLWDTLASTLISNIGDHNGSREMHTSYYNLTGDGDEESLFYNYSTSANADTSENNDGGHRFSSDFYLAVYGLLGLCQVIFLFGFNAIHWSRMAAAARELHSRLADCLLRAPMVFFDTTPIGRILNRVSYDVEAVDAPLPRITGDFLMTFGMVVVTLVIIMIQTPLCLPVLIPVAVLYFFCQRFFVPTARQLRRIECVSRSPIYVLFSETISGVASIRAYGEAGRFLEEAKARVDNNQVYFFAYHAAIRWMQWNLDVLSSIVVFAATVFAILDTDTDSGDAGLTVSYALQLSGTLTWMTRQICDFETNIVSVERLKEYSELKAEAPWIIPGKRPSSTWPSKGEITFCDYKIRYREGLDLVLKGISLTFKPGQKTGIVGRTGAGKSSLALSLFRLIESAGGAIYIDGVNIADMGLHDLRSRLTILPQDPVLFSGTLRMNLDPFDEYSDDQLWTALDRAHLKAAVTQLSAKLEFQCGEGGGNLSVGQRQLVCLARTLLRRTKILVLDEATAAVDMETDALIQNTIRSAFSTCTVITIVHRLNTVLDYDRILVMEAGRVKEFASPQELLSDNTTTFYSMARDAGLV